MTVTSKSQKPKDVKLHQWKPKKMVHVKNYYTVEAPISGHPLEAEKVSATRAGRLGECVSTVQGRVQTGFCQGRCK